MLTPKQKSRTYQRFILRQLGHAGLFGTRRFPHPSLKGFGFIGKNLYLKIDMH
jgi:hypothetical protein